MIGALSIFSGLGLPAWAPRVIAGVVLVMTLLYVRGEIRDQAKLEERIETAAATSEKAGEIAEKVERIERETDVDAARAAASRKLFFAPELDRPVGEPGSGARPARSRDAGADPIASGRAGGRDRDPVTRPESLGQAVDRDAVRRAAEAESSAGDAEQELIEVRWGTFFGLMGFGLLFISIPVVFYLGPRLGITGWVERAVSRVFYTRGHNDERGIVSAAPAPWEPGMDGDASAEHASNAERRHQSSGSGLSGLSVVGAADGERGTGGDQGDAAGADEQPESNGREGKGVREMALEGRAGDPGLLRPDDSHTRGSIGATLARAAFVGLSGAVAIIAGAAAIFSVTLVLDRLSRDEDPADYFHVSRFEVPDAKPSEIVVIDVERMILKPFQASWIVEVEKLDEALGGYVLHCSGSGANIYQPKSVLPDVVTLEWWIGHDRCKLDPGRYRIETAWSLKLGDEAPQVSVTSNVFRVGW